MPPQSQHPRRHRDTSLGPGPSPRWPQTQRHSPECLGDCGRGPQLCQSNSVATGEFLGHPPAPLGLWALNQEALSHPPCRDLVMSCRRRLLPPGSGL